MRFQDWPTRMDLWIKSHGADQHAYGAWDCALMAASHIDNLTGSDLYAQHAGQYGDAPASTEYLLSLGFDGLAGLARDVLGAPLKAASMAQRGDVVIFQTGFGPALGIVDLTGMKILGLNPSNKGFVRLPMALADEAWRV